MSFSKLSNISAGPLDHVLKAHLIIQKNIKPSLNNHINPSVVKIIIDLKLNRDLVISSSEGK